jgi:NADPH:quinone reductase-like Zn-dependent oxidoreductase
LGGRERAAVKAWLWERYGPPEALRFGNVPDPTPGPNEVVIAVKAASVNAADWHSMRGKPLFSRLTLGLLKPKHRILGVDVAGTVEAVGDGVTSLEPGAEVYANLLEHGYGGFAERVSAPVEMVAAKPASLSFTEAAAIPMAGGTALQALRHHGAIRPGQRVLVNGGSGGVGTFAVQIAKSYGPELTVVTSTPNVELMRSLGADRVVDYTTTDFVEEGYRYDRILDTVGNRSVADLRRALADGGKATVTGFSSMRKLMSTSLRGGQDVTQFEAHDGAEDLRDLAALADAGTFRSVIDRTYTFGDVPEAIAYLEEGHARGKVVVAVE